MRCGVVHGKRLTVALVALLLAGASGCAYLGNRWADAKQMMDLGLTFSKKPQFGLYANCPMVTPLGYSKVDGTFVGVGGGKLGAGEHHQNNAGALFWGREENSWKGLGKDDKATVESHRAGVVGIAQNVKEGNAKYRPACVHYLHLGFVGVMWNLNYFKMADFFCGWFGYIPFGDRNETGETRLAKADAAPAAPPAKPEIRSPKSEVVAAAKPERAEPGSSRFELGLPAEIPSAPMPVAIASADPAAPGQVPLTPPLSRREREEAAAAVVPPLPPDEVALAVARDVAAAKAEMATLRRKSGIRNPEPDIAAEPKRAFPLAQLVP